jgi:hypothetical protein
MQNHDTRRFGRTVAWATVAVLAFTLAEPATAGPASQGPREASTIAASGNATGFVTVRYRHVRNRGSAAGLAAMGMAIGTIGGIAARQQRNDYYDNGYGNQYAPTYYGYGNGGGPYYGNGPYYGGGYYGR